MTIEGARRDYGVAIAGGAVDAEATAALRQGAPARPRFDPGPFRTAHEARWTETAYAAMHELLATLPVTWRAPVKTMLFARCATRPSVRPRT